MKIGVYSISLVALFLVACGGESVTDSNKEPLEFKVQYESFDDLPNCTSAREGEIAEILEDGELYICKAKKWEEYVDTELKSYETEDDMPNCSAKKERSLALVEEDSVVLVCKNSRWETLGHPYANEDSLPNCTKKREGEKAYLMEEGEVQVCEDGVWIEVGKKNEDEESDGDDESGSNNSENEGSSDAGSKTKSSSSQSEESGSTKSSTSIAPGVTEGTFTDSRDGQKYRTVKIGDQEWFAQNLNYDTDDENSLCPLRKLSYCEKYGRLYKNPSNANCPTGWHVPYKEEWETLFSYVEGHNDGEGVGKSLKATSGWYEVGFLHTGNADGSTRVAVATGDDPFHFSALPSGSCWDERCYSDDDSHFWSIDESGKSAKIGYKVSLDRDDIVEEEASSGALSIRCIKDAKSSSSSVKSSSSSARSSSSSAKSSSSVAASSATVSSSSVATHISNYGTCAPAVTTAYLEDSVSWTFTRDANFPLTQYANATFQWNFPNGTSKSSTSRIPKSFYTEIGTYGASVVINGDIGNTITCSPKVNVVGNKITCSCTHSGDNSINVTDGPVDVTWTANCTSAADITGYYWDGSSINGGKTYVHAVSEGSYAPTLNVRNSQGVEVSASCGAVEGWVEAGNIVNLTSGQSAILGSEKNYVVTASSCSYIELEGDFSSGYIEYESGERMELSSDFNHVWQSIGKPCNSDQSWMQCFSGIIYLGSGNAEVDCL